MGTSEGGLRARVKWKQRGQCRAEWEEDELDEWRVTWLHADQVAISMSAMWGGCLYKQRWMNSNPLNLFNNPLCSQNNKSNLNHLFHRLHFTKHFHTYHLTGFPPSLREGGSADVLRPTFHI